MCGRLLPRTCGSADEYSNRGRHARHPCVVHCKQHPDAGQRDAGVAGQRQRVPVVPRHAGHGIGRQRDAPLVRVQRVVAVLWEEAWPVRVRVEKWGERTDEYGIGPIRNRTISEASAHHGQSRRSSWRIIGMPSTCLDRKCASISARAGQDCWRAAEHGPSRGMFASNSGLTMTPHPRLGV